MQSSPLPSSPPFMSGVYSSTFQSTLPRGLSTFQRKPESGCVSRSDLSVLISEEGLTKRERYVSGFASGKRKSNTAASRTS
ncbi:hypothetical protein [Treponema endosymbiont of Eucomonympha sp.]|uniref:hypothetical protein n=1 Tax=Treponema endosymbiont of Eucomonympha sp. TaxID=1580831 RepID=UPI00164F7000|nr:hypothetical protein [Treponema endosymbiont of Eucomonympha sp.]